MSVHRGAANVDGGDAGMKRFERFFRAAQGVVDSERRGHEDSENRLANPGSMTGKCRKS